MNSRLLTRALIGAAFVIAGCETPNALSPESTRGEVLSAALPTGADAATTTGANGAVVLFDNGSFSGPQVGRNASGPFTIFEDFRIEFDAIVTGIEWSQHDQGDLPYDFTDISFHSNLPPPSDDNLITAVRVHADRVPNNTGVLPGNLLGFDYSVNGLSIPLSAGTYWFGLRSEFPGAGATWDQTSGNTSTIPGRYQRNFLSRPSTRFFSGENSAFRIIGTPSVVVVDIDIKPGSDPNSINCNNENESIAVAILTTDDFDATTVDHTTVTFEGASETHVDKKTGAPKRHEEDVDGDGDTDLVLHFRLGDTDLDCESTEGTLTGETFDGQAIEGTDAVRMIDRVGGPPQVPLIAFENRCTSTGLPACASIRIRTEAIAGSPEGTRLHLLMRNLGGTHPFADPSEATGVTWLTLIRLRIDDREALPSGSVENLFVPLRDTLGTVPTVGAPPLEDRWFVNASAAEGRTAFQFTTANIFPGMNRLEGPGIWGCADQFASGYQTCGVESGWVLATFDFSFSFTSSELDLDIIRWDRPKGPSLLGPPALCGVEGFGPCQEIPINVIP